MRAMSAAGIAVLLMLGAVGGASARAESGTDVYGDVIRADITWTAAGSPYRIHEPVQVAEGATLRVEPGVSVVGAGAAWLFVLAGGLDVAGSPAAPVLLDGQGRSLVRIATRADHLDNRLVPISFQHARLSNGLSLVEMNVFIPTSVNLVLTDSVIRNVRDWNYLSYPGGTSRIERNVFVASGGFSIGVDGDSSVIVRHNRFATESTTGYWVRNWARYDQSSVLVNGNAFLAPGTPSVELERDRIPVGIDATGNYWGTTDRSVIDRMVLDGNDSIDRVGIITVDPILDAIPAQVPPAITIPPGPPLSVSVTRGNAQAIVSWSPPESDGGSPVTGYIATAQPEGRQCTSMTATGCTITGLGNGIEYQVSIVATNAAGASEASAPVSVTPATTPAAPALLARPGGVVRVVPGFNGGAPVTGAQYRFKPRQAWLAWRGASASASANPYAITISPCPRGRVVKVQVREVNAVGKGGVGSINLTCP